MALKVRGSAALVLVMAAVAAVGPAQAPAFTTAQLDSASFPMVGRLFTSTEKCTAGVVDAPNQSTIITAGHCLNSATNGVATTATFAPGFHDNTAPFGQWKASQMFPAPQWDTVNHRFDFAFLVIARNSQGIPVQAKVGALPIAFNQQRQQAYRIFGIPSAPSPPYDSQKLWACDTTWLNDVTDPYPGPMRIEAGCDFGVGASGGPWLGASGAIASVSSTSPPSDPNIERGPYLGSEAAALFESVKNISTAPAAKKRKCKKKKRHGRRHAAAAKKCKKKRRHH